MTNPTPNLILPIRGGFASDDAYHQMNIRAIEDYARRTNMRIAIVTATGAVGEGVTDDTIAIQRAIDSIDPEYGGIVVFPPGVYKITAQLNGASNIIFQGSGRSRCVILYEGSTAISMLKFDGSSHFAIRDLTFKTPTSGHATKCMHLKDVCYFDISDVTVFAATFGQTSQTTGILVEATFTGQVPQRGLGRINNYLQAGGAVTAVANGRGIELKGIADQPIENVSITGVCHIEETDIGVRMERADHCFFGNANHIAGCNKNIQLVRASYNCFLRPRLGNAGGSGGTGEHINIDANSFDNIIVQPSFFNPATLGTDSGNRTLKLLTGDGAFRSDFPTGILHTAIGCRVYRNANQSINDSAWTAVSWDTEVYDQNGAPGSSNQFWASTPNPTRITFNDAGVYSGKATIKWAASATGRRLIRILKNGTTTVDGFEMAAVADTVANCAFEDKFAAGDYIEVEVLQDSGGALNVIAANHTNVSVHYVGR